MPKDFLGAITLMRYHQLPTLDRFTNISDQNLKGGELAIEGFLEKDRRLLQIRVKNFNRISILAIVIRSWITTDMSISTTQIILDQSNNSNKWHTSFTSSARNLTCSHMSPMDSLLVKRSSAMLCSIKWYPLSILCMKSATWVIWTSNLRTSFLTRTIS